MNGEDVNGRDLSTHKGSAAARWVYYLLAKLLQPNIEVQAPFILF
jgi:hypothetical protein